MNPASRSGIQIIKVARIVCYDSRWKEHSVKGRIGADEIVSIERRGDYLQPFQSFVVRIILIGLMFQLKSVWKLLALGKKHKKGRAN